MEGGWRSVSLSGPLYVLFCVALSCSLPYFVIPKVFLYEKIKCYGKLKTENTKSKRQAIPIAACWVWIVVRNNQHQTITDASFGRSHFAEFARYRTGSGWIEHRSAETRIDTAAWRGSVERRHTDLVTRQRETGRPGGVPSTVLQLVWLW